MVIRRLVNPASPYTDTDWTDPAITPPDNAKRFKILGPLTFAIVGRASGLPNAAYVDLGAMTVDAYVLTESTVGGVGRGKSVVEVETAPSPGQVWISSSGIPAGTVGRLHLVLASISVPVVEVQLISGGRVLL